LSHISRSALVAYTPAEMFALVNDIDAYDQFLPWCSQSLVEWSKGDEMRAKVELSLKGIRKSFITCNRLQRDKMIEMRLEEGPFKHLHGFWRFDRLGESGCKISFDLEFEFSSRLLGAAFNAMFAQIAASMVDSFCQRAVSVYGKR
jgi:ribosome-associated toxin RatA of RatAB toxin-antitoxin module